MHNSFASKTEAQQDGLAVGYQKWFGIPVASPSLPFVARFAPAGYLNLSAEDFGHYLIAQLNNGSYQGVLCSPQPELLRYITPISRCQAQPIITPWAGKYNTFKMWR